MPDDPRVQELLDELLDRDATPEEVCGTCPELLPVIRERWRQISRARDQLDSIFPVGLHETHPNLSPGELHLPEVPGYEVDATLGRGGMGVVFRARHLRLGRLVALKMMLAGPYAGRRERDRFQREAEAVAALPHANVVQVYDVGDWAGLPYFTMELIGGGSLAQRLAGAPQPAHQAARLLVILAEAMHAAHQVGIIHRDLKPANILFTADGTPKVADFGLASRLEDVEGLSLTGVALGTPSYMAPEQAQGQSRAAGPAVDVYALGAILYEMLTGRPPFRAETAAETVRQVIDREPVPPARLNANVPRDLELICLKCLQKGPHGRYASAAALADDLKRFEQGRPIRARPLTPAMRLWRWGRRNTAAAALIATVLAVLGVGIGGAFRLAWERAERRAESVRREERETRAVEAAIEQASALGKQGRWPDAGAVLEGFPSLLSSSAPARLRGRLTQASKDARVAADLETIRLRLSTDPTKAHNTAASLYEKAFRSYGIDLSLSETDAAARVGNSAVSGTMLAYLHDWFYWAPNAQREKLRALLDQADDDPWRRAFREAVWVRDKGDVRDTKTMVVLATSPEALDQPTLVLSGLGGVLLVDGRREEALTLLRGAQQRHPEDFWLNYLLGQYWEKDHTPIAVGYFRAAVAVRPGNEETYTKLGRALLETKDTAGAIAAFRKALAVNPDVAVVRGFAKALAPLGGLEEARDIWEKILGRDPPDDQAWYGYAQLCLYLGNEEAYRKARNALLDRFGETTNDWVVAERASLACMLRPASEDDLRRAVLLADRAVQAGSAAPSNPFLQFLKGMAEFRQGRFNQAIPMLRESSNQFPNRPGPRLVLSMAQFQAHSTTEARRSLAVAVSTYNWIGSQADHTTTWVSHAIRREAESMILPNLPAFLKGDWRPQDNNDRLALLGICESDALYGAASLLYTDAFAADPGLAKGLTLECLRRAAQESDKANRIEALYSDGCYRAARCASLAGCGVGKDRAKLSETERTQWRRKALEWLRADLDVLSERLAGGLPADHGLAKELLTLWRDEPDLAGLREPARLNKLEAAERMACLDLWVEVATVLARCEDIP